MTPGRDPRYSPTTLAGWVYYRLWEHKVVPNGPMRDPDAANHAAADLLRAFGVAPVEPEPVVCGVEW